MKINGLQPQEVYKAYMKENALGKEVQSASSAGGMKADRVEISRQSADLGEARSLVEQSGILSVREDDRDDRVEELKSLIRSGQYFISSADVARSILTGKLLDNVG